MYLRESSKQSRARDRTPRCRTLAFRFDWALVVLSTEEEKWWDTSTMIGERRWVYRNLLREVVRHGSKSVSIASVFLHSHRATRVENQQFVSLLWQTSRLFHHLPLLNRNLLTTRDRILQTRIKNNNQQPTTNNQQQQYVSNRIWFVLLLLMKWRSDTTRQRFLFFSLLFSSLFCFSSRFRSRLLSESHHKWNFLHSIKTSVLDTRQQLLYQSITMEKILKGNHSVYYYIRITELSI